MAKGNIRKTVLVIVTVLVAVCGLVFLLRKEIMGQVNSIRAGRLQAQAEAAFTAEQWEEAARKGRAAHFLAPDNLDLRLLVARALLKQRRLDTVEWWKRSLDHPDLPVDELRQVAQFLIGSNRMEDGLLFLNRLMELDANGAATQQLWLLSLERQRQYGEMLQVAGQLVGQGIEDWTVHHQYLALQEALAGPAAHARVVEHLQRLIAADNALSLPAARELVRRSELPLAARLEAARYLAEKSVDPVDRLYAASLSVKEGISAVEALRPLMEELLETGGAPELRQLVQWGIWMGVPEWVTGAIDWDTYRERGGEAEPYLRALLQQRAYRPLIELTERAYAGSGAEAPLFLYYRALAWEQLGDAEQSARALGLALEVVNPAQMESLERNLVRDGRWDLLARLYEKGLRDQPGNRLLLLKVIFAQYSLGNQEELARLVQKVDVSDFEGQPAQQVFLLYLKRILPGGGAAEHRQLEELLARYPGVFDHRLVLGVSYLLLGRESEGRALLEGMPALDLAAPRFMRVCAVLLGLPEHQLISPAERGHLLPREQFLISRAAARSAE